MAGLEGSLLGMGNPLLDISAVVEQETLDKYNVRRVFADACVLQMHCVTRVEEALHRGITPTPGVRRRVSGGVVWFRSTHP